MPSPRPSSSPLIDFQGLTFVRGDRTVFRDLTLKIGRGEHVAILGPNGSGKSTLIKAITRELYPVTGGKSFRFDVLGSDNWDVTDLRARFGIVELDLLQNISHEVTLRQVTAREMVLSGCFNSLGLWPHHVVTRDHERRARAVLKFLEIEHLSRRPLSEMSSGEQRRVLIGRAMAHQPEALIFDEPTNSLDPGAVREFRVLMRKLARAGRSLILVTHNVADLIPEIDRVILVAHGTIRADGPKARVLTSPALSKLFGARLRVLRRGREFDLVPGA